MKRIRQIFLILALTGLGAATALAQAPTTLDDFFLPGSQPGQSGNIEHPGKCDNCHGGYDQAVEPAFNWRGSMMSQAMRDPFFEACMAVSNQDAPDVGDLCIRCHAPDGWLGGRSVPTDGSALNQNDREGVQCDFCHKLVAPSPLGVNPYPDDPDYTAGTFAADQSYLATLNIIPPQSGNGGYIADSANAKRGPFVDAAARHQMFYSPFHQDAAICGTCHDVSNPVYDRQPDGSYLPNAFGAARTDFDTYTMFPVERTYSEWLMSDYNTAEGVYAPQFGGNKQFVATCQDCHMRDVTGVGCNKRGAPIRDDLPLHDLTGGNTFIPPLVAQLYPGEVDPAAIDAGIARATQMLQKAATMTLDVQPSGTAYVANVHLINETGHKLPSGYPEGRRMWLNVRGLAADGSVVYESGAYDHATGILTHDADAKIYEIKPGISEAASTLLGLPAGPSFHFVLNNDVFSDNRIPPRGFSNASFEAIQSPPVGYSYADGQYWDDTTYSLPAGTARVEVTLYYQTTSKEYVEFLRDENVTNNAGQLLYELWNANGKSAPVAMAAAAVDLAPVGAPVAAFTADPTSGAAPLTVQFTDQSTGAPDTWAWDFGDGTTSTATDPTHIFAAAGTYTVALTVSNADGSDSATMEIIATEPGGGTVMHVDAIAVTRSGKGKNFEGLAAVTIVDQGGNPVAGATVTGAFNAPDGAVFTAVTDAAGIAGFASNKTRTPPADWCFAVNDVVLAGATYDPAANVVTSACESDGAKSRDVTVAGVVLHRNYPNPFNPSTTLSFELPRATGVKLGVYSVAGRRVAQLIDGVLPAGTHSLQWTATDDNGRTLPAGIYFVRLVTDLGEQTRRVTLVK